MLHNIRQIFRKGGFDIVRYQAHNKNLGMTEEFPSDFDAQDIDLVKKVQPFTMTHPPSIYMLSKVVEYIIKNDIPGDFVECGVWKGGSMMTVAYTLQRLGVKDRELYLYDTFEGMPPPGEQDKLYAGTSASQILANSEKNEENHIWAYATIENVRKNILSTGYDESKIHLIKGKVEDTIPEHSPEKICLLRLDTDWYESTKHELVHLYPRLSKQGVLIIDDYAWWLGSKKATDEYFEENKICMLLNRLDMGARLGIKY